MRVLGIESSCDETSAAVVSGSGDDATLESLVILSQDVHRVFGGVVPEIASRAHLTAIVPVVRRALEDAGRGLPELDAIAVTNGPALWSWICLVASVPAAALFITTQRRRLAAGGAPLVNLGILAQRPVGWGLLTMLTTTGTYYALLFVLAQYLQAGLGRSALVSGLTLVPWVAAFGLAGQVVRRLPPRWAPVAAPAGCVVLTLAYLAISAALFSGNIDEVLLVVLLGVGGFGLGIQFSALIAHLTNSVPDRYAPDISGVITTTMQIGAVIGVATLGTLYLGLAAQPGPAHATHAFAVVSIAFAAVAVLATAMAVRSTHSLIPGN